MRLKLFGVVLLIVGLAGVMPGVFVAPAAGQSSSASASGDLDEVILTSGRIVRGEILEQTDRELRMLVMIGSMSAETTYQMSEVSEIRRAAERPADDDSARRDVEERDAGWGDSRDSEGDEPKFEANDDTVRLYYSEIEGRIPWEFSKESLSELFEDADDVFGDIITVQDGGETREVVHPDARDRHLIVLKLDVDTDPRMGFDGIWQVNSMADVLWKEIDFKGRRVVFWIEEAAAGGAFVPLTGPEVYFTEGGQLGGIGSLDQMSFGGDAEVDEKQISLRLGNAEGFAIRAGFGENGVNVIRAMARPHNPLWIDRSTVPARTLLRTPRASEGPNWEVVSAPGVPLNLNAEQAFDLGISSGTVSTIEELAFALGIDRNYVVIDDEQHDAHDIIDRWADEVERALDRVRQPDGDLWRDFEDIQVEGDYRERTRARGQKIRILERISSILRRYEDYLDQSGNIRAQIAVEIEQLKQQQQMDRPGRDGGGQGGGGGRGGGGSGGGGGFR